MLHLRIDGFSFDDLHRPAGLQRLHVEFLTSLRQNAPSLATRWSQYLEATSRDVQAGGLSATAESELLIELAQEVSRFVGRLFGVEAELASAGQALNAEQRLFEFRREFVAKRVFKKGATDRPTREDLPDLDARVALLLHLGFGATLPPAISRPMHLGLSPRDVDHERALAEATICLMHLERAVGSNAEPSSLTEWEGLRTKLLATAEGQAAFGSSLVGEPLAQVRALLSLLDRWTFARAQFTHTFDGWSTATLQRPLIPSKLVELKVPDPSMPEMFEGPPEHLRRRDGFKLTDSRGTSREAMGHIDTCVLCHERGKDSCRHGFPEKDPSAVGTFKPNAQGVPLTGCPLDERISEMHTLKGRGDSLAALAMVVLDNPMCAGTGHRICNECMKACIFQKQEPVNIPQVETSVLTDVLALPYGFEIYGLLTRWNPLNVKRPYSAPDNGKKVLVVGQGPAGYTLAHHLLNEGFTVVGVDGLKVEPFPDSLTGADGKPFEPIADWTQLVESLDERIAAGFGGVSEYGITVRWDKSFLSVIHLTLARREGFRLYGGVRFGGTLTVDDAWDLGFDHIALAAGAGKPTLVPMKNNLLRGIRAASDFLMALQLTGASRRDSLANLQVRLPALVIGGGLTGIDTATELLAYYPMQVEKVLHRHERLVAGSSEAVVVAAMSEEERGVYAEFLEHGRAIRQERERAQRTGEAPDFVKLVRAWGGVALCYRRGLTDAPAYRLNHEEVTKALEEGIRFIERVSPIEAVPDAFGAVSALRFERMTVVEGKLKGTGQCLELPARTVCIAAGTSPNVMVEREHPHTFELDEDGSFFKNFDAVPETEGFSLVEREATAESGSEVGFFTSYQKGGRFITFYGDNHPTYAGNVVKAMASARDGYPHIVKLFKPETTQTSPAVVLQRAQNRQALFARLNDVLVATVVAVNRLTPTIVEVVVKAPFAAAHFEPGQFYRLQNFERAAPLVDGTRLSMEGLALTGAWVDKAKGLLSTIVLEMGVSSRMCALLEPGQRVVLMGPTGAPTHIPRGETVLLAGGGLGNAVLFSIGQALRSAGCRVLYFAGFRRADDVYKLDDLERAADQVVWSVDAGPPLVARRPGDKSFVGNIVQAMQAFAAGDLGPTAFALTDVDRILAIGSDRMMKAVQQARHGVLAPHLKPEHCALGSINSPMQCMMKEICAQCLQRHVDPRTGKESFVFSCFNQDQELDSVDFAHLDGRLRANSVLEKQSALWFAHLRQKEPSQSANNAHRHVIDASRN